MFFTSQVISRVFSRFCWRYRVKGRVAVTFDLKQKKCIDSYFKIPHYIESLKNIVVTTLYVLLPKMKTTVNQMPMYLAHIMRDVR